MEKMRSGLTGWWQREFAAGSGAEVLDMGIMKAMVPSAKAGIFKDGPLQALSVYMVYHYGTGKDYTDAEGVLVTRVMESDLYLDIYRRMEAGIDCEWVGDKKEKRQFPLWGVEYLHQLDTPNKAKLFYREELIKRKLIKP